MRNGNGNFFCVLIFTILIAVATPTLVVGQSQGAKTEDLVKRSDLIVVGKVGRKNSEWNEDRSRIQTRVSVTIDQTIKGTPAGKTIMLVVPGGEVGGVGEWYSHTAQFAENEDVVVFARKDKRGDYRVAGGEHGKVSLEKDKATGNLIVPNLGTLDQFTSQVKTVVKAQETETLQPK